MLCALQWNTGMIADAVVILSILIFALVASYKGFFKCLIGFIGTVLSIVLSFIFCKTIASYLQEWFGLLDKFTSMFTNLLVKLKGFDIPITSELGSSLEAANVPAFIVSILVKSLSDVSIVEGTSVAQVVAPVIANMFLLLISFLSIFIIIKILCFILDKTLGKAVTKIPVVRSVNSLLGFVLGFLEGAFLVYSVLFILAIFQIPVISQYIETTSITFYLYNHNVLGYLINWVVSSDWIKDTVTSMLNK